ncbi:MAG: gliding motility-associated C-terminal domain-containing protein [Cytophagaceae bacterium]
MKILLKSVSLFLFFLFVNGSLFAQVVSPYTLSPQWRFGAGGGVNFPTGNFPTSTVPTATGAASNPGSEFVEASTAVSDRAGNMAIYSNTMEARNVANATVRNMITDVTCGGSSTGGGTAIPDPANPDSVYYLFVGNDITGGLCGGNGINYYKFKKNGSGQAVYLSGPTLLIASAQVDESITAGNDGKGNYWIISHAQGSNTFKVWSVTASGVTALADQVKTPSSYNVSNNQSYLKLSPCQNKIAWAGGTNLVIYNFDRTTGTIGSQIKSANTGVHGVGLEFSPDGNTIYTSGQGTIVQWFDVNSAASGTISGSASWSMQLGPDGNLYCSPSTGNFIGVINNLNTPASATYSTLSIGSGSTFRGLINVAWLSPELPVISASSTACNASFSYQFKNYFLSNVSINPASIVWNFGDGSPTSSLASPSHTYAANGSYTVTMSVNDATCGHTFTATKQITISGCVPPPSCTYNLQASINPVADTTVDNSNPTTVNFDGTNSVFDAVGIEPHKYYWMIGSADTNTAFSTSSTSSRTFAFGGAGGNLPEGTYTVYLVIRQGLCLDTTTRTFNVVHPHCTYTIQSAINPVADTTVDDTNPTTVNFNGTNSVFDAAGTEPHQYYWMMGSADTSTAFSSSPTSSRTFAFGGAGGNLPEGTYTVYLVIREGLCLDTATRTFKVVHPVCTYNLQANIAAVTDTAVDGFSPITLNFSGTSSIFDAIGTEAHKFYWINGSADTSLAFATTATPSLSFAYNGAGGSLPQGAYTIYLVTNQGLCLDTAMITFNVNYDPCALVDAKIKAVNEAIVGLDDVVNVDFDGTASTFSAGPSPKQYYWMIGSADTTQAFSNDSIASLDFSYKGRGGHHAHGSYDIYLVVKDDQCLDTISSHLNVDYFFIPNLITPNGDSFNDGFEITNIGNRFDLEVYNRWGERIFLEKGYTNNWDLSKVHDGMYYYLISDSQTENKYKGWVHVIHASM